MARDEHNKAAEHHESAAKSHRAAAEHHGKGDHAKGKEHSSAAQQHSQTARQHSEQSHAKSSAAEVSKRPDNITSRLRGDDRVGTRSWSDAQGRINRCFSIARGNLTPAWPSLRATCAPSKKNW